MTATQKKENQQADQASQVEGIGNDETGKARSLWLLAVVGGHGSVNGIDGREHVSGAQQVQQDQNQDDGENYANHTLASG